MEERSLRSRFRGCLIGAAVGDALGMPVEGMNYLQIQRVHGKVSEYLDGKLPKGSYTDDTQLMIALGECLEANNGVDQDDLARRFVEIYDNFRGYGAVFRNFVQLMDLGWGWRKASREILNTFSASWNGSAMRVAPVAALYAGDPAQLERAARASGEVTHCGELAQDGCALQALAVALAIGVEDPQRFEPAAFVRRLREAAREDVLRRRLLKVEELLGGAPDVYQVIKALGNTVEVQNSVPTAIYCFLRSPGDFEETVTFAVGLGGDADTVAAMAGAISGALNGEGAIPRRWIDGLEHGDRIAGLADRLCCLRRQR